MKGILIAAVLLLVWAPALQAVDPALLNSAMPDARVVAGADLEKVKASAFGRFLLAQMEKEEKELQQFVAATGFDPRRDLQEVLLAASEPPGKGATKGLVLARGLFDVPRIQAMVKGMGMSAVTHDGVEIILEKQKAAGTPGAIAFLQDNVAALGDLDSLKAAIDRRKSSRALDAKVAGRAQELSADNHIWLFSTLPVADMAEQAPSGEAGGMMRGDAFKSIEQVSAGLRFGDSTVRLMCEAVARTEKDASAVVDIVKFLTGMIQLNREKKGVSEMAAVLDTLEISAAGVLVKLTLTVPEEQMEKLIRSRQKPAVQAAQ
jgi:hypothetical protein